MTVSHRLFAILLAGLALLAGGCAQDPLQQETVQFFPLPLDGSIEVANIDGSIHVFGWYEPRVRLAALRRAYTSARLREIAVRTQLTPRTLTIASEIPKAHGLFADRSGTIDYSINVPEPSHLKLRLRSGEVTLQGLRGANAEIQLVNGRITALNCFARVRAHSTNGVMEVFFQWWENLPGAFDYTLEHGRIAAGLPAGAPFRVDAATANGRIGNGFGLTKPPSSGTGDELHAATAPNPPLTLRLRTGGGNITIDRIP